MANMQPCQTIQTKKVLIPVCCIFSLFSQEKEDTFGSLDLQEYTHKILISFTAVSVYSDYAFCLDEMKNKMTEPYSKKLTDYLTLQIQADNPHEKEQSHNVNQSL